MLIRLILLLMPFTLFANSLSDYFALFNKHPEFLGPTGSWKNGEIEVILDPTTIKEVENTAHRHLLDNGVSPHDASLWSQVGIVAEDQYLYFVRDAVYFPSGEVGTYDRFFWKSGLDGPAGVAILGVLENEKIVLNLNYRHATRTWEVELPRGMRSKDETADSAVKRELKEETGGEVEYLEFLGNIAPDSGILSSIIPVYFAKIARIDSNNPDYSEAIESILTITLPELQNSLTVGYLDVTVGDRTIRASVRDPFLTFALNLKMNKLREL